MKLKVLALAVAASVAFPMAAQAEFKISGDVGVGYASENGADGDFREMGSEINFDGSMEVGGLTYSAHIEADPDGAGSVNFEEMRVGIKGGFGQIFVGETDNACDMFDPDTNNIFTFGRTGSCVGVDKNNISFKTSMGPASVGISHKPTSGAEITAVGAKFSMGGFGVNLGYETGDGVKSANAAPTTLTIAGGATQAQIDAQAATNLAAADDDRLSYGISGSFGGFGVNVEGNDQGNDWGLNVDYSTSGYTFWASTNHASDIGLGARTSHGNMDYVLEMGQKDSENDMSYLVALRYRF